MKQAKDDKTRCVECGKTLPPNAPFTYCEPCLDKWMDGEARKVNDSARRARLHRALDSALDMARFTIASANAALKAAGHKERLVKGNGYYYFAAGDAARWYSSSIATNSISNWNAAMVLRARNQLASDYRN